ncbi:hypothetical protein JCM6882_006289 [Rhodosporidiobolus microsporus]
MTLPQEDDTWPREGPVRWVQKGGLVRKNGPVACDGCRKRRVRCSGFETGAPCDSCRRRETPCVVGDDTYPCDADEQTVLFYPILPPPGAPCSSPSGSVEEEEELDADALAEMLQESAPRPAPLVWKVSPEDTILLNSGTTTRQREKRLLPAAPSGRTKRCLDQSSDEDDGEETAPPPSPRPLKKRKVPSLRCQTPAWVLHQQHEQVVVEAALALYSLKSRSLVSVEEWQRTARREENKVNTAPTTLALPVSSSRNDPLPSRPSQPPFAFPPSSSPLFQPALFPLNLSSSSSSTSSSKNSATSSAYGSRRASLVSSTSASTATSTSAGSSFFYGGGVVVSAEGSVTSASSDGGEGDVGGAVEGWKRAV